MAQQLIFTSTPQGLEPGRSGYCTVARHKDLRHRLVRELERLSVYDFGQQVGGKKVEISIYRKIILGSEEFYVLTKICDAGLDYTNRTNYLAHHLILDGFEIATCPSPAEIFLNWSGWKKQWEEGPRYLTPGEEITLTGFKSKGLVPCKNWLSFTNDPGNAASLVSPSMVKPIVLENSPGRSEHLLQLFAESCALLKISLDSWDYSFTTFLQGNDDTKSFAWLGIEGQPAGERLKQGGLRNYIDLREWSSSSLSDETDTSLAHIARKGPTAPATKRVKKAVSSNTRSPLSSSQIEQIKGTSSPYMSAAPSGSSVKPQEQTSKKEKKKRPWLIQLAVISTALCLLGALIVGLAYNLGDWFNKDDKDPTNETTPNQSSSPLAEGNVNRKLLAPESFAQLNQVEYLKIVEKNRFLRWVKLDVGSQEPLRINIKDDQFDRFERALDKSKEGDELRVIINEVDDELIFEDLSLAPPPNERGKIKEVHFADGQSFALNKNGNDVEFVLGDETFTYDLRRANSGMPSRLTKLSEALKDGQEIPLNFRIEGKRVVHIEPFELSDDQNQEMDSPKPNEENKGDPMVISVGGKGKAYFEPEQMRIQLPVNGTNRKAYIFKENEAVRIKELFEFLESDQGELDINIRYDGDLITYLDFELPQEKPEPNMQKIASPHDFSAEKRFLFWVPGKKGNGNWRIDDSLKSLIYNDPEAASLLFSYFQGQSKNTNNPTVWMADYKRGSLFGSDYFDKTVTPEECTFECQINLHPLDPVKIAIVSFKLGKSYSFDLEITNGKSIEISYDSSHAWNSLTRGKVVRLPIPSTELKSIDLFLLSNQHAELEKTFEIGQNYNLSKKQLTVSNKVLKEEAFRFLSPGEREFKLLFSLLDSSVYSSRTYFSQPSWKDFMDFKKAKLSGLPTILLRLDENSPFRAQVLLDLDYFRPISEEFLKEKQKCDSTLGQLGDGFPEPEVYKNLENYGKESQHLLTYNPGSSYEQFAYSLPLVFVKKYFIHWDEVKFNNLKGELDVIFNNDGLVDDPRLFLSYWTKLAEEVEQYISDSVNKDFNYEDEKAMKDIRILFDFLTLMLKTEMALGVTDQGFLEGMREIRGDLASASPEKTFGILNAEILGLSKSNPALLKSVKLYNDNYRDLQRKLVPSSKLNSNSLKLALETISDLGKNVLFKEKEKQIIQNQVWSKIFGEVTQEILIRQDAIIKESTADSAERAKNIVGKAPWTLSVYQKNSEGEWNKLSDFLRLASPTNL